MIRYSLLFMFMFFHFISCSSAPKDKQEVEVKSEDVEFAEEIEEIVVVKSYNALKSETLAARAGFKKRYDAAKRNSVQQDSILSEAEKYLVDVSDEYFKAWYGTPWDFNGHTKVPGEGEIACGYLVTTVLKDMGFNIPRIKWAQQASAYIVKQTSVDIKEFLNQPMEVVAKYIQEAGEGLYVVGLDNHVGFIYYWRDEMAFVHSNYYRREIGVMSEPLIGWNPLSHSKYRIIGKIFQKEMVRNWILNTAYPV